MQGNFVMNIEVELLAVWSGTFILLFLIQLMVMYRPIAI